MVEATMSEVAAGISMDRLKEFVALEKRRRVLEAELAVVKKQAGDLEPVLREQFAVSGVQNMKMDGLTVSVRRSVYPKYREGFGRSDVIEALRLDGLADLLKEDYSTSTFTALVRDIESSGGPLPENLARVVEVSEQYELRTQKA
jgi:hypothetical protein